MGLPWVGLREQTCPHSPQPKPGEGPNGFQSASGKVVTGARLKSAFLPPQRVPATQPGELQAWEQSQPPRLRVRGQADSSLCCLSLQKDWSLSPPLAAQGVQESQKTSLRCSVLTWEMGVIRPLSRLSTGLVASPSMGCSGQVAWEGGVTAAAVAARRAVPTD